MLKNYKEKTKTRRFASRMIRAGKNLNAPKSLKSLLKKHSGRSKGKITVRHQGGRNKRHYRKIDFKRNKLEIEGTIVALEYDPNRNVDLALVKYVDGDYRYILAAQGLKVGDKIKSGVKVEIATGNAMMLKSLPIGTVIHNVELKPGQGGQLGRGAGTSLTILAKEGDFAHLRLPSGEVRMIPIQAMATVGVLGNEESKNIKLGKAGRSRHLGIKPTVRGVAQDPRSHAHGGGEAKSGVGRKKPMTKYGRPAVGKTRPKYKQSNRYIMKKRK